MTDESDHDLHELATEALPMKRIAALWDWLPAFRAVAETENLRRAATFLALSPPALSRTLKLLEEAIGSSLFEREGRRLRLTPDGRRLFVAVRRAMRQVDDALSPAERPLRIHALAPLTPLVARALGGALPFTSSSKALDLDSLAEELLRGELDLLITTAAQSRTLSPSTERTAIQLPGLAVASYGDPQHGELGIGPLAPFHREGSAVQVDDLATGLEIAARGLALTLPIALAPRHWEARDPIEVPLAAIRRVALNKDDLTSRGLELIKSSLSAAGREAK